MEAAKQGRTACCAALADAARAAGGGGGLNAWNERGRYSALHYACYEGATGEGVIVVVVFFVVGSVECGSSCCLSDGTRR